jgi:hypothetical protein
MLKEGLQLVQALQDTLTLLPDAVCYTTDALSMYSNINTNHSIATITQWLELHCAERPLDLSCDVMSSVLGCNASSEWMEPLWVLHVLVTMQLFTTANTKRNLLISNPHLLIF